MASAPTLSGSSGPIYSYRSASAGGRRAACCAGSTVLTTATSRQVRATSDVPILFLSARDGDSDKIRGLRLGSDDYIAKSATPDEVVARVQAVLRRTRGGAERPRAAEQPDGTLDFGRLVVDVRAHEVWVEGRPVPMPAREFALLCLFAEHPRQIFSHDRHFTIARRILQAHGGDLTAANAQARGALFTGTLPANWTPGQVMPDKSASHRWPERDAPEGLPSAELDGSKSGR